MSETAIKDSPRSTTILALWLWAQLISLGLSAFQVRLSYRWVDPPERWAVEQMLAVQIAITPFILLNSIRSVSFAVTAFFTGAAMLMFARMLAAGETHFIGSIAAVGSWILVAHLAFRIGSTQITSALLTLWILGGVLLHYAAIEFGGRPMSVYYSPITAAITLARDSSHFGVWLVVAIVISTASVAILGLRSNRKCS